MPGIPAPAEAEMAQAAAAAPQEGGGDAQALAAKVGEDLAKLSEMMNSSDAVGDEDRSQMSQVLSMYTDLIGKLGQPAEEAGPVSADQGMVSAQGGAKGIPMGPQSKM